MVSPLPLFLSKAKTKIHKAEFVQWAKGYRGEKFHAVLSDPPYGLEFMGKEWDSPSRKVSFPKPGNLGGFADGNKPSFARQGKIGEKFQGWARAWGEAMIPILYPGALVFMFGGTRMWHRLAVGMEDAGFELLDTLMWLYGSGFPKAYDVSQSIEKKLTIGKARRPDSNLGNLTRNRWSGSEDGVLIRDTGGKVELTTKEAQAWQGYKTPALKPAWEPILMFRAPRQGKSYAQLAQEYGSGCLNVDGGRVETDGPSPSVKRRKGAAPKESIGATGWTTPARPPEYNEQRPGEMLGRYPANLILDEEAGEMLDGQSGDSKSTVDVNLLKDGTNTWFTGEEHQRISRGDSGGASRFFYCAKASRREREGGLDNAPIIKNPGVLEMRRDGSLDGKPTKPRSNNHPTVKPISLTWWLANLLLPPDSVKPRRLLVPFAGSGSEMIGAIQAGWDEIVGIEKDEESVKIAEGRVEYWKK